MNHLIQPQFNTGDSLKAQVNTGDWLKPDTSLIQFDGIPSFAEGALRNDLRRAHRRIRIAKLLCLASAAISLLLIYLLCR